jgi:hypothetical protein
MGPLSGFESHPTFRRLEDQIVWYDTESTRNKHWYEGIKVVELVSAASVPLAAVLGPSEWLTGGLGVLVVVLEGVQQLKQFHANWISYRSTGEALKHEKFLFLGQAGPYEEGGASLPQLAARTEELVSREHAKWVDTRANERTHR